MRVRSVAAAVVTGVLLTGCSHHADESAGTSAEDMLSAAAAGNGARACQLLSPSTRSDLEQSSGKPCRKAILEEHLTGGQIRKVEVFDTMAVVYLTGQTVFLSRFDSAWLVTAAACTPVPHRPYDCAIQGA
jgi:hypothetical protein